MATTSGSSNYSTNRDLVISRALRICEGLGQGETAQTAAVTEAAQALNDLVKQWETDGMPLWKIRTMTAITLTATQTYSIGIGQTVNQQSPLRVLQAWLHDTSVSPAVDVPVMPITRSQYGYLNAKTQTGVPNLFWYDPPGANVGAATEMIGTLSIWPLPDTTSIANKTLVLTAQLAFEDFDVSTDVPDFPSYWNNALVWGLAAELSFEYGVPFTGRSMIKDMRNEHKQAALLGGTEEGSFFIQPTQMWGAR